MMEPTALLKIVCHNYVKNISKVPEIIAVFVSDPSNLWCLSFNVKFAALEGCGWVEIPGTFTYKSYPVCDSEKFGKWWFLLALCCFWLMEYVN